MLTSTISKYMRLLACSISIVILFFSIVDAKTLYVNNSGSPSCSDATTYANNSVSLPWCTVGRAAFGSTNVNSPSASQAAAAGDTVLITAGTYTTTGKYTSCNSSSKLEAPLNAVNIGSAGSPITFRGVGVVNLRNAATSVGPTISILNASYIIWDNFVVSDAYGGGSCYDTGPVTIWSAQNSQILNLTITGIGDGRSTTDNYCGVRIENSRYITVRNNRISNIGPNEGHNAAGIMTYYSGGLTIENNEIYNCGSGIFLKANTTSADPTGNGNAVSDGNIIKKNFIYNCGGGINMHRTHLASGNQIITQNIIKGWSGAGDRIGVYIFIFGDAESDPNNVKVVNNTIVAQNAGFNWSDMITSPSGNIFHNNIIYSPTYRALEFGWGETNYDALSTSKMSLEHNVYYNYPTFLGGDGVSSLTIAQVRSGYGQDSASPQSITSDPLFVNYAGGDYKLQSGSPAQTLGRTITAIHGTSGVTIPAGAYITGSEVIGIDSGGGDTTPPVIDNLSPSGVQACTSNPRNVTLSLTTNENATARMATTDIAYSSMTDTFTTTGGTSHNEVKSLACGASYTYYVRASDSSGNANTSSSTISFSIASPQIAGPGGLRITGGRLTN